MKNTIIVAHSPGGLGNILVQLAHITAFCIEQNTPLYAPTLTRVSHLFNSEMGLMGCLYPELEENSKNSLTSKYLKGSVRLLFRKAWTKNKTVAQSFGGLLGTINIKGMEDTLNLETSEFRDFSENHLFILLSGWRFRSPNLVIKHAERIRHIFRINSKYEIEADRLLQPAKETNKTLVGIHIRKGDYQGGEFDWPLETYISIMESIKELVKNPIFVVCSNEDIYEKIPKSLDCIFPKSEAIIDMLCLSKCALIAAPPSTFSGWASFMRSVPLYKITSPEVISTLDQFTVETAVDGPCDGPVIVALKDIMR